MSPRVKSLLLLGGLIAVIVLICLSPLDPFGRLARSAIYHPPRDVTAVALDGIPPGGAVTTVRTSDGLDLKGIVYWGNGKRELLLVFHGNAMTASQTADWFRPLIEAGYTMIFAEYRGYSGDPGSPSEKGTARDAAAWSDLASRLAGAAEHPQPVFYVGHSLGGAVAFQARAHAAPDALITIGAFTDVPSLAPPGTGWLIADRYDNRAHVAGLKSPYYIAHGTADQVIPVGHSEQLFKAAQASGKQGARFTIAGAGHNPDPKDLLAIVDYAGQVKGPTTVAKFAKPNIAFEPFSDVAAK